MAKQDQQRSSFSKILTNLMKEKGYGIRELARLARVSHASLYDWKSGHHCPTDYEAVGRLADALGVSLSFLLRGKDDKATRKKALMMAEMFEDGELIFDGLTSLSVEEGFARVKIQRLIPRYKNLATKILED